MAEVKPVNAIIRKSELCVNAREISLTLSELGFARELHFYEMRYCNISTTQRYALQFTRRQAQLTKNEVFQFTQP
ncbi:MAG: hypothetical protein IJZ32_01275 [Clostridia bacterium]|nr:hypothetical protein [Clostridia bacterium]